jgi:hypothetical protein
MPFLKTFFVVLLLQPLVSFSQNQTQDLADSALISVFQRDGGTLVCSTLVNGTLRDMREVFNPFIKGINLDDKNSYKDLAIAVYSAFPCPFSPVRNELRLAKKEDFIGSWVTPQTSIKLRFPPKSKAWVNPNGVPPIKCEGVAYLENGTARVMQIQGEMACPDIEALQRMNSLPAVSTWGIMPNGRLKITRSDVPTHFEEWEMFAVESPFKMHGIDFAAGDLVGYLRRAPGNEINVSSMFRHLKRLK